MSTSRFSDVLHDLSAGRTLPRLNHALAELVDRVQATQGKGSLVLKIDVTPMGEDVVRFEDEITVKEPKPKKMATTFFVTEDGLSRRDPRQADIEDFTGGENVRRLRNGGND